jgi:hypothetical protein
MVSGNDSEVSNDVSEKVPVKEKFTASYATDGLCLGE